MSFSGEYGKKIVAHMPHGLIFCAVWSNLSLDTDILQFEIAADGKSVLQKELIPEPNLNVLLCNSFDELLKNRFHIVTASLGTVMRSMNKTYDSSNMWRSSTLLAFDKEVIRKFVDPNGVETNQIYSDQDSKGRRRIMFFLRTVESMDEGPQPADIQDDAISGGAVGGDAEMEELRNQNLELQRQMFEFQRRQEEMMRAMMEGINLAAAQGAGQQQQQQQQQQADLIGSMGN